MLNWKIIYHLPAKIWFTSYNRFSPSRKEKFKKSVFTLKSKWTITELKEHLTTSKQKLNLFDKSRSQSYQTFFFVNKDFFLFSLLSLAIVQNTYFFHMLQTLKLNSGNRKTGKPENECLVGSTPEQIEAKIMVLSNKHFSREITYMCIDKYLKNLKLLKFVSNYYYFTVNHKQIYL